MKLNIDTHLEYERLWVLRIQSDMDIDECFEAHLSGLDKLVEQVDAFGRLADEWPAVEFVGDYLPESVLAIQFDQFCFSIVNNAYNYAQ